GDRRVVRALMELDADRLSGELDGRVHGRLRTDVDALADDGRSLEGDRPAALAVVGAPDLTPLASAEDVARVLLEEVLVVERIDQPRVDEAWVSRGEGLGRGWRHDLDVQTFRREQALVPGDEPMERQDCGNALDLDHFHDASPRTARGRH